jgi:PPOX class probable F420-dependent enzyme
MTATFADVRRLAAQETGLAVLTTTRPDGSVHASVVNVGVLDYPTSDPISDPISGEPAVAAVIRGDARKLDHLRRTGRATVVFRRGWDWVAVDGPVRIVGPQDSSHLPALLREIFTAAGGQHDDWPEFDRVMAAEKRVAVFVRATRITGNG